jgi:arylsulfatase A-like enzyme
VRTRRWKYIRYIDQVPVREELYDLQADPTERVNLAGEGQHADRLRELRERCESLIGASG